MKINPMSLKFMFEEDLFFFHDETILPSTNNKGYIGENNSQITILSKSGLEKEDLKLLEKILLALKLSISDIALKTTSNLSNKEFIAEHKPKHLILFGISPFEVGLEALTLGSYEIKENEGIKILQAEDFQKYSTAADKKKALWFALQKLFV